MVRIPGKSGQIFFGPAREGRTPADERSFVFLATHCCTTSVASDAAQGIQRVSGANFAVGVTSEGLSDRKRLMRRDRLCILLQGIHFVCAPAHLREAAGASLASSAGIEIRRIDPE